MQAIGIPINSAYATNSRNVVVAERTAMKTIAARKMIVKPDQAMIRTHSGALSEYTHDM
jgi:hypothetical protein